MPQIAAAVVVAISYVGSATAAVVAGTATLAQIATVAAVGIGAGVGSMAAAKALTPEIGSQGAAVRWEANPDAPLRFAFGRVGVKGNIVDAAIYGPDRMYVSFACSVSAAGPIKRFVSFRAGDHYMLFDNGGAATNEPYKGEMWLSTRLGTQPDTALSLPSGLKNGVSFPGWNASRKMSGSAGYLVTLGENSKRSAYEGKIPAFVTTIEGLFCYDPRQDSTYPGGAGSCRLNDPSTWVWTQNPILFALKWALGLWEGPNGKGAPQVDYQVGGIGAKVDSIRLTTVVEAANIADANGWTSAAWPSTDDDKAQVLDGFLKAAGARYAEIAGQIAFIHRAAPRAPVFTVRARDTAGPVEIDTASSKLNRFNTVRPRFWSEAHDWEMTALPEVTATEWQTEDGQGTAVKRTRGADYTFVVDPKQARELASLEISNSREGIKGRVPLRPYMDPEPGNTFIFDEPDFALSNLKCFVLDVEDDTENDTVVVTFETETDGKYPYAYGQTGSPPPAQELDPRDPFFVSQPFPDDWVVTPRPPSEDGTQQPGFDLTGLVSNATATAVIVEWGAPPTEPLPDPLPVGTTLADYIAWEVAYQGPPDVQRIPITGLQSGQTYYIAVRYQRNQNYSKRYVYGPYEAPTLKAGISDEAIQEVIDEATKAVDDKVKEAAEEIEKAVNLDGLFEGADDLAEAVLKIGRALTDQQRWLDRLGRQDGLPMGVYVQQNVEVLKEADRQEVTARTELGAALNGNIAAAEQSISAVATNLSVESQARLVLAGRVGTAEGAIVQETSLRVQGDQAEANLRSALALVVGQNKASAENSISAVVSNLGAEVTAREALAVRVGNAEGAITSEASVRANQDSVFVQNFNLLGARKGDSSGWILSQSTVEITGEGTLSQVLSGLRATDGQNSSSITTLQQASGSQASQLTTLSQTVGGQTTSISQLLSVTAGLGARYTLNLNGNGEATSFIADGQTRAIIFKAASLTITDDGNGLSYQPATGRLKIVKGGFKTILGASSSLNLWSGSTSIPDGSEVYDNGTLGIGADGAYFGGRTNNGPFDSGAASSSTINLPKNTWTTIAAVNKRMMQEGDLVARVSLDVLVTGAPDEANDYGVEYRIAVANLDGSGAVNVVGNFGSFVPNVWTPIGAWLEGHVTTSFGDRRILLQVRPTGSTIATASARNGIVRGQYAMSS